MQLKISGDSNVTELDAEILSKVKKAAFDLLNYRKRSRSELINRLERKNFNKNYIEKTISYLEDLGYVNDNEFSKAFIRDRVRNKNIGPIAVRNEISKYNVDPEIIEESIELVYREYPVNEIISSLIKTRLDKMPMINNKEKEKMINLLKRKGFYWDDIKRNLLSNKMI